MILLLVAVPIYTLYVHFVQYTRLYPLILGNILLSCILLYLSVSLILSCIPWYSAVYPLILGSVPWVWPSTVSPDPRQFPWFSTVSLDTQHLTLILICISWYAAISPDPQLYPWPSTVSMTLNCIPWRSALNPDSHLYLLIRSYIPWPSTVSLTLNCIPDPQLYSLTLSS